MTKTSKLVKRTHDSGSWTYGVVEGIGINTATIRLMPAGTRLTNLPIAGSRIKVGDTVMVDYASGKPIIRPITPNKYDNSEGLFGFASPGFSGFPARPMQPLDPNSASPLPIGNPTDIGCRVWAYAYTEMDCGSEYNLQFRATDYDTNEFYDVGDDENLLVKIPGLYICILRIGFAVNNTADTKYVAKILVDGTIQSSGTSDTITDQGAIGKVFEISGALVCGINSAIRVKISQNNSFKYPANKVKLSMSSDNSYHMYPTIQLQWLGVVE